ncbi:MAG: sigma 54-interacting transcriptional regulator [Clostridiales bacterium]|nr:sigma 54-interacting transcriptional regulator [Clostridiales bacterium]
MSILPEKCINLILEQAGVIAVTDKDAKYIFVNKRWEEDTGISKEKAIGKYNHDLIEGSRALIAIKTGQAVIGDVLIKTQNGKELPGVITYMPIFDGNDVAGCFISSSFLNVDQANAFLEKMEAVTAEYEFLKGEMKRRNGARYSVEDIIGQSDAVKRLKEQIYLAGASNSTVLINGETGTGKELVAHAIHSCGLRNIFPLVKVNCSAIPENLMESEFFGYEEGTFTGGKKGGRRGKFEEAHLGSLFLDEVNHLCLPMQPKLLRVLQEKEFERLGSSESTPINVRVIAATNVALSQLIRNGLFREDLFYRLNIINITVPPLRERKEDISLLVDCIIQKLNKQLNRNVKGITRETLTYLKEKEWPGNVRELHNALERAINASRNDELTRDCFTFDEVGDLRFLNSRRTPEYENADKPLSERKKNLEKEAILNTLEICGHNKSKAAKMLNISRTMLYKKMDKYQIACKL